MWFAALSLVPASVVAGEPVNEPASSSPLSAWHGQWIGEGMAFGRRATALLTMAAEQAHGETRLTYALTVGNSPAPTYAALAVHRTGSDGRVLGNWLDRSGRARPVAGRVKGDVSAVNWGSADTEIGRSV